MYQNSEKWLNFQKFQLKWKILKHFTRPKQRPALRKLFSPSPDKSFLRLWNNNFLAEIYWNMQKFAFQVLRWCSSWVSGNGHFKCYFWRQPETYLLENLQKWVKFFAALRESIFYNVEWVEARKIIELFWVNGIVKWVIVVNSFCWLWDFLLQNLNLKEKLLVFKSCILLVQISVFWLF